MGSVKDVRVILPATPAITGLGEFIFSDRYSVFDWGEMPDHPRDKGAALCTMTAYFFEQLEGRDVPTHYLSIQNGHRLSNVQKPPTSMDVELVRVIKPEFRDGAYDYSVFGHERVNHVIPLEVIYRNSLPKGSSVFRRLKDGTLTVEELGLTEMPVEGQRFAAPLFDGSTKYESSDRYPGMKELQRLATLADAEMGQLRAYTMIANDVITKSMARAGLVNEDGKFEFIFRQNRDIAVGDTLGTLDECRITHNGVDVSKQVPRDYYEFSQPTWVAQIKDAKERAKTEGTPDWKQFVTERPEPLPRALLGIMENFYRAVANAVTERNFFPGASPISETAADFERFKTLEMKA